LDKGAINRIEGFNLKISNRNEIIIGILGIITLLLSVGSIHAASVDVDGWTFTADLGDRWQSNPQKEVSADMVGWSSTDGKTPLFEGIKKDHAFWLAQEGAVIDLQNFPSYPSPKDNGLLALVGIWVNKVPKEVQYWSGIDILSDYHGPKVSGTRKDIKFNGRPALLTEVIHDSDVVNDDGKVIVPASSMGQISILMTEDTIVALDAVTTPETGLDAWDVLEKITISPASSDPADDDGI
jgi:hypothetical protein